MVNSIIWFRNDLRITDNAVINYSLGNKRKVLPVYIYDPSTSLGSASKWWLKNSLISLNKSLKGNLMIIEGEPSKILLDLVNKNSIKEILWNERYSRDDRTQDNEIINIIKNHGVECITFHSCLLKNPQNTLKKDVTPFKVYTPFYKQQYQDMAYELFNYNTEEIDYLDCDDKKQISKILDVAIRTEKWHEKLLDKWSPGEAGAQEKLKVFLSNGLNGYSEGRNRPDKQHTSMLSPHIRFGEISIREIAKSIENINTEDAEIFYKELVWREFSYHLLYHFPHLVDTNLQKKFNNFKWLDNQDHLKSWQKGMTGYPIIDAGMRQLYETGYMHNRVRMIVGSFLVKNLMIHWKYGQEWFWDTLVDADIASNSASWQWVAGTGADAAPYFRIFNPVTQSKKFDPNGDYIKKYIPVLKYIPSKNIHLPSELDSESLRSYGVELGHDYPKPIVDLSITRERALDAFKELSKSTS
jgi:deoxyribodipyrimidine photo-lyase